MPCLNNSEEDEKKSRAVLDKAIHIKSKLFSPKVNESTKKD